MRLYFSKLKKFFKNNLPIFITILSIFGIFLVWNDTYVHALISNDIQQAQLDYDHEVELEYSVPTLISEESVPPGNIFGGQIIGSLYLKANFSENNGSIWINDQNNATIWKDYLNSTIENNIDVNSSSIRSYSLWANSSILGNATLYFTFRAIIFHAENFGLGILIVLLPIIIIGIIIFGVITWKKKEPHSVRVAMRIVERMKLKYEAKHPEKVPQKEKILCPKCGAKAQNHMDNFCKECGFKLKE